IASSIAAGVVAGNGFCGDAGDAKMTGASVKDDSPVFSTIRSVTIGGQALGTLGSVSTADSFGFVAQQIGSFKINGFAVPLAAGAANDLTGLLIGITGDLHVLEVGL